VRSLPQLGGTRVHFGGLGCGLSMVEDANPEAVILPTRDYMDAAETISWIGYGKALRKYHWCERLFRLSRNWEIHDVIGIETEDPPHSIIPGR
jgi:hypothetical protein